MPVPSRQVGELFPQILWQNKPEGSVKLAANNEVSEAHAVCHQISARLELLIQDFQGLFEFVQGVSKLISLGCDRPEDLAIELLQQRMHLDVEKLQPGVHARLLIEVLAQELGALGEMERNGIRLVEEEGAMREDEGMGLGRDGVGLELETGKASNDKLLKSVDIGEAGEVEDVHATQILIICYPARQLIQLCLISMYSILKTQKRSIEHAKSAPPIAHAFLSDIHILIAFADATFHIYHARLDAASQADALLYKGSTRVQVTHIARLSQRKCVMLGQKCAELTLLEVVDHSKEEQLQVLITPLQIGMFPKTIFGQNSSSLFNSIGGQVRLHGFPRGCFIIEYILHEDKKVVLDCYEPMAKGDEPMPKGYEPIAEGGPPFNLTTGELDLQINGSHVLEVCDGQNGELALYKQTEIEDADWKLQVLRPFRQQTVGGQLTTLNYDVTLPSQHFRDGLLIMQVLKWLDDSYLILVAQLETGALSAIKMHVNNQNSHGVVTNNFSYHFQPTSYPFLNTLHPQPLKLIHINLQEETFYALTHVHQRIDGELYENGFMIGSMRTGQIIERGYCTLKNYDLSPNSRLLLDMPWELDSYGESFYHMRVLLSKKSLYMFLIESTQLLDASDTFKETILSLLA